MRRTFLPSLALVGGFFFLLLWFYVANVYQTRFFDHGGIVAIYQLARIAYIPYLFWLEFAVGAYVLYLAKAPFIGLKHIIAAWITGTSLWHIVLLGIGLAGLYHYPIMLLLTGGVMIASLPYMAKQLPKIKLPKLATRNENFLAILVAISAILFLLFKGTYPTGGHDFFNHYFPYYKAVIRDGSLGPNEVWYHYFYSKGLGLYFLSMILLDPLALNLVGTTFVIAAALMVFDLLRAPNRNLVLPLFGVLIYVTCYIYTPGRGIFAANGGWGDLEKTHELTAVLIFACIWLFKHYVETRERGYLLAMHLANLALVIIGFASGLIVGMFYAIMLAGCLFAKRFDLARAAFFAGASAGIGMVAVMIINYINTGIPQDQLVYVLWWLIDWQKIVRLGWTLELYTHLHDLMTYERNSLPLTRSAPKIAVEYFRLFFLGPFLIAGLGAAAYSVVKRRKPTIEYHILFVFGAFMAASMLVALFLGGREQPISYFRFSTFNYAPVVVFALLWWMAANDRIIKYAIYVTLAITLSGVTYATSMHALGKDEDMPRWFRASTYNWGWLATNAFMLDTGQYSLDEAVSNQRGRPGRLAWGGTHPSMRAIYELLPPKTKVWNLYNHGYCSLPACNMQMYFSQITAARWYDIALGDIATGKKIMQEAGINFIFYSRNIPSVMSADGKDQLTAFYPGLQPENIDKVFGILWTNGWDYLLTWKEESLAPLDDNFMDSWRWYHESIVEPRRELFPIKEVAKLVKSAISDPQVKHPPAPNWSYAK